MPWKFGFPLKQPWITFGIQKSISIKSKLLLKKSINKKDPKIKAEFHEIYKIREISFLH